MGNTKIITTWKTRIRDTMCCTTYDNLSRLRSLGRLQIDTFKSAIMKPLTTKRIVQIFLIMAILGLMAFMSSCATSKCRPEKMVGYGSGNWKKDHR